MSYVLKAYFSMWNFGANIYEKCNQLIFFTSLSFKKEFTVLEKHKQHCFPSYNSGYYLLFSWHLWVYSVTLISSQQNNTRAGGMDFLTSIKSGSGWGDWHSSRIPLWLSPVGDTGTPARWLSGQGEGGSHCWCIRISISPRICCLAFSEAGLELLARMELKVKCFHDHI